jgi:hypothetical protein
MNPALQDLHDIHLPAPVSWWPPAPGWWLLAALLALIVIGLLVWRQLRRRNNWRRYALGELATLRQHSSPASAVRELSVLLRRVAISRFPREEVAALSGDAWLGFLDRPLGKDAAFQTHGQLLVTAPYARDSVIDEAADTATFTKLFDLSERWLKKLPGGRR